MTDIRSQDDLNEPETHSTEVLLSTIEELDRAKKENLLLKIANAELRSRLDTIITQLEQAFYDDKVSFWDILVKIKKGLDK